METGSGVTTAGPALFVEPPQFERLPPAAIATVGAEAVLCASAGLIALLDGPAAGGEHPLGSGYQAPFTVPFGLTVSAAIGALGMPDPLQDRWMVRSATIHWRRGATHDDRIRAAARVVRLNEREAIVEASASGTQGRPLLETEIRLVPMIDGRYAALDKESMPSSIPAEASPGPSGANGDKESADGAMSPLPQLRPIRFIAGGASQIECQPDVLRLLTHPLAGHAEPLGRRAHPLGGAPLGAALTVALLAAGEANPDRPARNRIAHAQATWYSPLPANEPWRARLRSPPRADEAVVDVLACSGRSVLAANVGWTEA